MKTPNILDPHDFEKYLEDTAHIAKVVPADAFADDVAASFYAPLEARGDTLPFTKLNHRFRFRPGEVTIWAGFNGHGKSLLLGQAMMHMISGHAKKVCVASMEMKPATTLQRIARQFFGSPQPTRDELSEFFTLIGAHFWLYDHQGVVQSRELIAAMKYCARDLGIHHFVIDSLMKCGMGEDDYNGQKSFVDQLCSIGRDSDMHIHLVCHSRKAGDESKVPGKMDIRGSGSISDQVDNVITVWRNKDERRPLGEDAVLQVDKQRNGEWEGKLMLTYNQSGQSFQEFGDGQRS